MAAAALIAIAPSATADQIAPTVVALWHMDEPEGLSTMVDSSGFGNDGRVSSDVLQGVSGVLGTAYAFTGSAAIVNVPDGTGSLNPGTSPLLVSASLNVPTDLTAGDYNIIQKGTATAQGGAYKLEVFAPTSRKNPKWGYPDCAANTSATATDVAHKDRAYGPQRINDGLWHVVQCHLTETQLYVTVDDVKGTAVTRTVGAISNSVGVTLGGKPTNTHYFRGMLDEVSITIG